MEQGYAGGFYISLKIQSKRGNTGCINDKSVQL